MPKLWHDHQDQHKQARAEEMTEPGLTPAKFVLPLSRVTEDYFIEQSGRKTQLCAGFTPDSEITSGVLGGPYGVPGIECGLAACKSNALQSLWPQESLFGTISKGDWKFRLIKIKFTNPIPQSPSIT